MKAFILLIAIFIVLPVRAQILVGSFDSHFDFKHDIFHNKVWQNPHEIPGDGLDNDGNGFIDDVHGWNFADNNNLLFAEGFNVFPNEIIPYAEGFMRRRAKIASQEELDWLQTIEESLRPYWGPYVSYIHGTGSAGLSIKNTKYCKVVGFRAFSDDVFAISIEKSLQEGQVPTEEEIQNFQNYFFEYYLNFFKAPIEYASKIGVRIMNIGFLLNYDGGDWLRREMLKKTGKLLDQSRAEKMDRELYQYLNHHGSKLLLDHPEILFLLPAGNGSTDMDKVPSFPQGILANHIINVGASIYGRIAPYSNFGKRTVDALMPTAAVYMPVPHNNFVMSTSTSISGMIITNLSALILEENLELTNPQIKEIIIKTSTSRPELTDKVVSGGIIHPERAIEAARNTKFMTVKKAIARSFEIVRD